MKFTLLLAAMLTGTLLVAAPAEATTTAPAPSASTTAPTTAPAAPTAAQIKAAKAKAKAKAKAAAKKKAKKKAKARAAKIVRTAAKYKGTPYRWGGTSPKGFDCSGYTQYVYRKAIGKKLPRIAGDQMHKGHSVKKSAKKKGDLIGFYSGNYVYHVAIYAGGGKIWHSPRTGETVKKVKIWTSAYKVRRL